MNPRKLFPKHIKTIAVTAPAGAPDPAKLASALDFLQQQVQVKTYLPTSDDTADVPNYLAGSAGTRLDLLNAAIRDEEVDMILCARGGFGCVHLLNGVDYDSLRRRQLPLMGYSDITALHCAMLTKNAGIPVAGSNLIGLENLAIDNFSYQSQFAMLALSSDPVELPEPPQKLYALLPEKSCQVSARAYSANLTVLASLCGTGFMPDFNNMILILEDVNEPVYKLDRMLTQLLLNGVFENLAALVFGIFSGDEADSPELAMLLQRIARRVSAPCFGGFQFGHTYPMCAVSSAKKLTLTPGKNYLVG